MFQFLCHHYFQFLPCQVVNVFVRKESLSKWIVPAVVYIFIFHQLYIFIQEAKMGFKLLKKRLGIQDVSLKSKQIILKWNFSRRDKIWFGQVGDFMTQFDSDCDGKMSLVEFQKAVEKLKELEAGVWWSFANIFDQTGYILFLLPVTNKYYAHQITLWNVKKISKKLKYWKLQFCQAVASRE